MSLPAGNAADLVDLFESVLSGDGKIRCIPIDRAILRSSARLKSRARLKLADSIHVATALAADARRFLSNDLPLLRLLPPRWPASQLIN
ncbi:MAG: PIN domain-containing protein [Devosia sp.]|nr:PIN domain-containing protein [Devosia sp.]